MDKEGVKGGKSIRKCREREMHEPRECRFAREHGYKMKKIHRTLTQCIVAAEENSHERMRKLSGRKERRECEPKKRYRGQQTMRNRQDRPVQQYFHHYFRVILQECLV